MPQEFTELTQTLRRLVTEITTCNLEDRTAVDEVGVLLQTVLRDVPETLPELHALLQLALQGIQTLHQRPVHDRQRLTAAIITAMVVGEHCLCLEEHPGRPMAVYEAIRELGQALEPRPDTRDTMPGGQASSYPSATAISLDDAAALLMQLAPTDTAELVRLQDGLNRLVAVGRATPYPSMTLTHLAEAARRIDHIVWGEAADPSNLLTEVCQLIAMAIETQGQPAASIPQAQQPSTVERSPDTALALSVLLPDDTDRELLGDFITECREYIEGAEAALLSLETSPDDMEAINTVFRAFHTIKGTAAFLGLTQVSELAHHAESLLSRMRDRAIRCAGGYADLALRSVDMLKELIQALQDALGGVPTAPPEGFTDLLHLLTNPEASGVSEEVIVAPPPRLGDILVARGKVSREDVEDAAVIPPRLGDILVAQGKISREDVEDALALQGMMPLGLTLTRTSSATLTDVAQALRTQQHMVKGEQTVESSVRVRTDRLDRLIDMVGELVIAHSMVAQDDIVLYGGHHEFLKKITHTGKIVRELQDLSMSMRMVPFKAMFQKMTRVVRDVAQKSRKAVHFVTDGEETEIDRNMVDIISDPLVHMVRNAVDHGIEPPERREQQGKLPTGTVRLSAYHAGGNVVVELQDDGRGLRRDKIVEKAIGRGLIDSDKGLSDTDVFNLIFEPGFSTAEQITDVSGRGVGMDVVKRSIEALKGHIEILSEAGKGTTFVIYLPLTLAITDGMLVRVGQERYIIPTIDIYKSFRPGTAALSTVAGRGELVMLRDEFIPLFRLYRLFGVSGAIEEPTRGLLVVVNDGERHCALLVDELLGQQQVVAKIPWPQPGQGARPLWGCHPWQWPCGSHPRSCWSCDAGSTGPSQP
jgi:two-component system, chemotaxis family, sensor kinase CheA